jgi:hypothetical protein
MYARVYRSSDDKAYSWRRAMSAATRTLVATAADLEVIAARGDSGLKTFIANLLWGAG